MYPDFYLHILTCKHYLKGQEMGVNRHSFLCNVRVQFKHQPNSFPPQTGGGNQRKSDAARLLAGIVTPRWRQPSRLEPGDGLRLLHHKGFHYVARHSSACGGGKISVSCCVQEDCTLVLHKASVVRGVSDGVTGLLCNRAVTTRHCRVQFPVWLRLPQHQATTSVSKLPSEEAVQGLLDC